MRDLIEESVGVAVGMAVVAVTMIDLGDPAVLTIGGAILATLTGTVKVLWDRTLAFSAATEAALTRCETEHKTAGMRMDALVQQVIDLTGQVNNLQGRIQGFQEAQVARPQVDPSPDTRPVPHG